MSVARPGDASMASRKITRDRIEQFATLTGDDNPLHLDDEYASDGLFDGPIAHGMLAAGVISSALADLPGDIIYLSQDLQFERPVFPGQCVTATAEVVESLGDNRLAVETIAEVEGETVVSGDAVVLSLARESL